MCVCYQNSQSISAHRDTIAISMWTCAKGKYFKRMKLFVWAPSAHTMWNSNNKTYATFSLRMSMMMMTSAHCCCCSSYYSCRVRVWWLLTRIQPNIKQASTIEAIHHHHTETVSIFFLSPLLTNSTVLNIYHYSRQTCCVVLVNRHLAQCS